MTIRRIGYVLNIFPKLSETFIAEELAELRRRDIEMRILVLQPPRDEPRHRLIEEAGLDQLTCYDSDSFAEELRVFRPDLIHAHFAREATAKARELSAQLGVGFTFTAHGYDIHRKPPPDFLDRAMAAKGVVTVSEANAKYITATFNVPSSRLTVIPCGVDIHRFHPNRTGGSLTELPLVLCVARHVPVKNLSLLLDACAILKQQKTKFRCMIVGDGPLRPALEQQRSRLALDNHVGLPGAMTQTEVAELWRQAAVGVLTSDNEGMPVALMEAAASGVPVVASAVGGIPELVADGVTGCLCPPGNAESFASAIGNLLANPPLRLSMGQAARARAECFFSIKAQGDALIGFWSRVCNGGQP